MEGEFPVFKVLFPDRDQQRCRFPWNAFLSGLWSRTLISLLVEASKIFSQDRVHLQILHIQLVFVVLQMGLEKGFSALFPKFKKVRRWARARGRNCSPSRSHPPRQLMWTPGSMATLSGSALTLCMGHSGRSCCQTTFSGTRRGNGTDGGFGGFGSALLWLLRGKSGPGCVLLLVYPLTQWPGAAAGAGCTRVLPASLGGL